jgi:methionyl-tRNA formyltransferase
MLFFGASSVVIPLVAEGTARGVITAVITTEHSPADPLWAWCVAHHIPVHRLTSWDDPLYVTLTAAHGENIALLASYGKIIPDRVIDRFSQGILNIHPSLLPQYRGPTPVQQAILDGVSTTGVSIIRLDDQMDHGPILAQQRATIDPIDTAQTLMERLFALGANMLFEQQLLDSYLKGTVHPTPQDDHEATYCHMLTRESGFLDSTALPKHDVIRRMVRAYIPWPGVWMYVHVYGKKKILKLIASDGDLLLQIEGKKAMTKKEFLNGYPMLRELIDIIV